MTRSEGKKSWYLGDMLIRSSPYLPWRVSQFLRGCVGTLPSFYIAGFPKCGTTSLYGYLIQHPQIMEADGKEQWYFSTYPRIDLNWYKSKYPYRFDMAMAGLTGKKLISGDSTPDYLFREDSIRSIRAINPNAKFIVLVREPCKRSYSYYQHQVRAKRIHQPFTSLVEKEYVFFKEHGLAPHEAIYDIPRLKDTFLMGSAYAHYLEQLLKYFPREQVLLLQSEDLFSAPSAVVNRVCEFLGVDACDNVDFTALNVGGYKDTKIPKLEFLQEFYRPFNQQLQELFQVELNW